MIYQLEMIWMCGLNANKVTKSLKKVNRKVQEESKAEAAASPDTRRKRKSDTD